jgi:hypothetical protein
MVSVPAAHDLASKVRETLDRQACPNAWMVTAYEAVVANFPQPAPQPHPEPIAWMVGTAIWWTKEEAERDAAAMNLPVVGLGPMTNRTAVEVAESETMAAIAELAECEAMADMVTDREWAEHVGTGDISSKVEAAFTQLHNDLHEADDKLVERDALLREWLELHRRQQQPVTLHERTEAALSASAEPSAPAPMPAYMEAACDKFDWTPEEALRFYSEGKHFDIDRGRTRILCTGAIASHALKGMGGEYADMKGVEPSAPVERDERAAFESWAKSEGHFNIRRNPYGYYRFTSAAMAWKGWQARAALERKSQVQS